MGIPWEYHGNGNSHLADNENGNGNNAVGIGIAYFNEKWQNECDTGQMSFQLLNNVFWYSYLKFLY